MEGRGSKKGEGERESVSGIRGREGVARNTEKRRGRGEDFERG